MTVPACVSVASCASVGALPSTPAADARAMPKSSTLIEPSVRTITVSGFTSRWTRPSACAAPRARAIAASHATRTAIVDGGEHLPHAARAEHRLDAIAAKDVPGPNHAGILLLAGPRRSKRSPAKSRHWLEALDERRR